MKERFQELPASLEQGMLFPLIRAVEKEYSLQDLIRLLG